MDEPQGWLYFRASPANPTQRCLYRSKLDGSGSPERVTPGDQPGTHTYDAAPGARLAFHTWSQIDRPPATEVVELPSHRSLRALTDPSALRTKLTDILKPPAEFFKVDIGGGVVARRLDAEAVRHSIGQRKYPVVVFVYGEPAGQMVTDRWGGVNILFHRALAEAGLRRRQRRQPRHAGAEGRGVAEDRLRTVGDLSSKEQAAAIRAHRAESSLRRRQSARDLGLERRRIEHAQRDVPLSRRLSRSASRSRRCPISGSTTRSTRSATWDCRGTTRTATGSDRRSTSRRA